MPELPDARRHRFVDVLGLPDYDAAQLTQSRALAEYFEAAVRAGAAPKAASNWMMGELTRALKEAGREISSAPIPPERLAGLLMLIENGTISGAIAKGVFEKMFTADRTADEIVSAEGLTQIDDQSQIQELIASVMRANPDAVKQYRAGKTSTFGFLVGQVMRAAKGKANPQRVNQLLQKALGSG
jgi:aspartyl-tRNA(Asn)/glutamyl-tRNA(Gln) amidotransferase subunit B